MSLTKVNISQNNCQSPMMIGGRNFVYNLCLLFMCDHLHFSNILLTHTQL
jgi:hypothetical protein